MPAALHGCSCQHAVISPFAPVATQHTCGSYAHNPKLHLPDGPGVVPSASNIAMPQRDVPSGVLQPAPQYYGGYGQGAPQGGPAPVPGQPQQSWAANPQGQTNWERYGPGCASSFQSCCCLLQSGPCSAAVHVPSTVFCRA